MAIIISYRVAYKRLFQLMTEAIAMLSSSGLSHIKDIYVEDGRFHPDGAPEVISP